jgi:hypothetical protein
MNERLWVQAPTEETIWIKNVGQKEIMECSNLPGIVACAINPLMGGWTLSVGL